MSDNATPVAVRSPRMPARLMGLSLAAGMVLFVQALAPVRAEGPRVLTCTFTAGQIATYENGKFRREQTSTLTFDIGDVDLERQVAALITPRGRGELRVVRAINANHFLEVVTEGFLNITTVYDVGTSVFPAVHSRHLGLLGQPVGAQYQGECRART
ncbi:MAG: hypothetical protein R3D27_05180 [Hyphomicrobiaceae bacterium]